MTEVRERVKVHIVVGQRVKFVGWWWQVVALDAEGARLVPVKPSFSLRGRRR